MERNPEKLFSWWEAQKRHPWWEGLPLWVQLGFGVMTTLVGLAAVLLVVHPPPDAQLTMVAVMAPAMLVGSVGGTLHRYYRSSRRRA